MKPFTIGELAKQANVGIETIRFYERLGLLEEPTRRPSGYRQYDHEAVEVVRFIRRAKDLGFTLKEIKGLLSLRRQTSATKVEVRQFARLKLAQIEAKIADLQRIHDVLAKLVKSCHGSGTAAGCPILQALQGDEHG